MLRLRSILKPLLAATLTIVAGASASAQDVHFSQFFDAPLYRNPSLAGLFEGDVRVQGVYRSQWENVTVPYKTGSVSAEYKFHAGKNNDYVTAGLQMVYDKAGTTDLTATQVMPVINYHKSLSDDKTKYLSLGFMGGWVGKRLDRSKITTNNQFDGYGYNASIPDGETFAMPSYNYLDGSVGMVFNSGIGENGHDSYYIGVAYHHFNRPKNSFYKDPTIELSPKWVASAGVKFSMSEKLNMTILADVSRQGDYQEIVTGGLFNFQVGDDLDHPDYILSFGALMRLQDAVIPMVKLYYKPFTLSFSYDANISALKTASQGNGGFELGVSFVGFLDRDNSTKNAIICPRF